MLKIVGVENVKPFPTLEMETIQRPIVERHRVALGNGRTA